MTELRYINLLFSLYRKEEKVITKVAKGMRTKEVAAVETKVVVAAEEAKKVRS